MQIGVGDSIGQYRLLEQLGQGGMAAVYRAYQASLDREVAVKILTATWGGPDFLERFRREARAVSKLRHPNILAVFDFGEENGLAYMVGELITGGTLAQRLGRPLPLEWVGIRLTALASALDYAHEAGLIHRDVKPSNILLTSNDVPILSDFGVAKVVMEGAVNLTQSGMVVGTPEYMSPEQALGQEVGPSSDVYSLGVVLYEMLAGQPPFSAPTPVAVALAHVHNPLPAPRSVNPALPVAVEQVLFTCLAKSPTDRFQRATDLAAAFATAIGSDIRYLSHLAAVTPPASPRISLTTPPLAIQESPNTAQASKAVVPAPRRPEPAPPAVLSDRTEVQANIEAPPTSGRRSRAGLIGGLAVGLALLVGATRAFEIGPFAPPAATPTVTRPAVAPTSTSPAVAPTVPIAVTPTVPAVVEATTTSLPTPRIAESPKPQTRWITTPINGALVGQSVEVRGVRYSPLGPNDHLWLMVRPRLGPDNWWAVEREVEVSPDGQWRSTLFLGGEPGTFHRILVGVADQQGHQVILKHLREQPGQPFEGGLPAGFKGLDEISVEKRGD